MVGMRGLFVTLQRPHWSHWLHGRIGYNSRIGLAAALAVTAGRIGRFGCTAALAITAALA